MFRYQIVQVPSFKIDTSIVDNIFESIGKSISFFQNGTLNIVFVSPKEIQELNRKYRNKDEITDVLSFHYFEDFSELGEADIAGELVFCESKIISQGKEYVLGSEKEFYKLLIHSVLHILGYDHEKDEDYEEMKEWEDVIWKNIF